MSKEVVKIRSMTLRLVSAVSLSEYLGMSFSEKSENPLATVRGAFNLAGWDAVLFTVSPVSQISMVENLTVSLAKASNNTNLGSTFL